MSQNYDLPFTMIIYENSFKLVRHILILFFYLEITVILMDFATHEFLICLSCLGMIVILMDFAKKEKILKIGNGLWIIIVISMFILNLHK